jgi:bilin biosynthesis protein
MLSIRRYTDVAMLVLGVVLLPALAGCNGLAFGLWGPAAHESQKPVERLDAKTPAAAMSADDRAVFATVQEKDAQGRERCVWVRSVDPESSYRWHYPKLDAVLAQPDGWVSVVLKLLDDPDPKIKFNAAIALGRASNHNVIPILDKAIRTPTLPLPMRCAAAETLGNLCDASSGWPGGENEAVPFIQKLIDQYGRYVPKSASYMPELHEELLRAYPSRIDAADDPRFLAALKSPRAEVRVVALEAWSRSKHGKLPQEAVDLRTDGDPRVRAAALAAIVGQKHPQALDFLRQGLLDLHFTVRKAAIDGLGALGGPDALATLKEQYQDRSDGVRAEAVRALAAMRDKPSLFAAAGDSSWRVRAVAAEALAYFPGETAEAIIEKLLDDASGEVRTAAVRVLGKWPLERSGPILLTAMAKPAYSTRKEAAEQLAQRWPPAAKFTVDAPADRRDQILRDLDLQFRSQFGTVRIKGEDSMASPNRTRQAVSAESIAEIERMIVAGEIESLIAYGPRLFDMLEAMRFERRQTLPESIYRDVLPKMLPEFAAIDRLSSRDVNDRRAAARELQATAAKQPCRRLAWDRLTQLMATETDNLVWLSVLQAASNENSAEAATMVCAGLGHSSSEVRREACVYLTAHPDRRYAASLLPALEDSQSLVVCAAAEALAAAGMDDPAPLKRLLNSTDDEVQLAAAIALTQLNDPSGKPALERLAYSNDPQVRARVAHAMGEYPDPEFIPILIQLLSDRATVSRSALASLPQVTGEDIAKSPSSHPLATAEQISRWKRWYERK